MYTYRCIHMHIFIDKHIHTYTYSDTCICTHICTHTYTHISLLQTGDKIVFLKSLFKNIYISFIDDCLY